ncbi:hypothetical protein B0H14DRAFT_2654593 [Mycena olivaceomarginata]|nr:hypothetical protein B0H14DRAFT_2654593 [Mycena olivaceomarginata]
MPRTQISTRNQIRRRTRPHPTLTGLDQPTIADYLYVQPQRTCDSPCPVPLNAHPKTPRKAQREKEIQKPQNNAPPSPQPSPPDLSAPVGGTCTSAAGSLPAPAPACIVFGLPTPLSGNTAGEDRSGEAEDVDMEYALPEESDPDPEPECDSGGEDAEDEMVVSIRAQARDADMPANQRHNETDAVHDVCGKPGGRNLQGGEKKTAHRQMYDVPSVPDLKYSLGHSLARHQSHRREANGSLVRSQLEKRVAVDGDEQEELLRLCC